MIELSSRAPTTQCTVCTYTYSVLCHLCNKLEPAALKSNPACAASDHNIGLVGLYVASIYSIVKFHDNYWNCILSGFFINFIFFFALHNCKKTCLAQLLISQKSFVKKFEFGDAKIRLVNVFRLEKSFKIQFLRRKGELYKVA